MLAKQTQSPLDSKPRKSPSRTRTASALDTRDLSPQHPSAPCASLSDMYPDETRRGGGGTASVDYLDGGGYDYVSPAPDPLYSRSATPAVGYYSPSLDTHGPPSDDSLPSLGSGPTSPLVFVPSSPQLSPFLQPPSHPGLPGQQIGRASCRERVSSPV